jgi:hypothetical protein
MPSREVALTGVCPKLAIKDDVSGGPDVPLRVWVHSLGLSARIPWSLRFPGGGHRLGKGAFDLENIYIARHIF